MKPLLIDDNDPDEINFDIDFDKLPRVKEFIDHWSGKLVQYDDGLAVGCK